MHKEIYLAGGCFWGMEKYLSLIPGVVYTEVGYANGKGERPTYEEVCRKNTGHAETVKTVYDDGRISLEWLLHLFYEVIDPTAINRQGNDRGIQYRTGVYYTDPTDRPAIERSLACLQEKYLKPLAVEVRPVESYWPAEEAHQKYLDKNPAGYCHIGRAAFEHAANAVDKVGGEA